MSVTVADLLQLPSLRQAKVIAGENGLGKIVSSISVLESSDPSQLVDGIFRQGEFFGSEIVITGFLNCTDNVEAQAANIKRLAEGGEVGLILFYVGIYMPHVDKRLIDLADELDFVLIQMPPSKVLRYGEVINDVTEYIFNDKSDNELIASDILARVSRLPEHQRTINTVLRMVSDDTLSSVVLTDASYNLLNIAAWPQRIEHEIATNLPAFYKAAEASGNEPGTTVISIPAESSSEAAAPTGIPHADVTPTKLNVYTFPIIPDHDSPMRLFLIKEGSPLSRRLQDQVADVIRICVNIWGKGHGAVALKELIRAILQDDPIKMKRLADIFHIDIAEIHEMWILSGCRENSPEILQENTEILCDYLKSCADIVFADMHEGSLLIFSSTPYSEKDAKLQADAMLSEIRASDPTVSLSKFSNLQNTTEVRSAYLCNLNHLDDAKKIFPMRHWFSAGNVEFAEECNALISRGEDAISAYTGLLSHLELNSDDWDAVDTLGTYLLDADSSITKTAALLHIHQNTVKYRLNIIDNYLGYRHDKMPDVIKVYYALGLGRLLK